MSKGGRVNIWGQLGLIPDVGVSLDMAVSVMRFNHLVDLPDLLGESVVVPSKARGRVMSNTEPTALVSIMVFEGFLGSFL